MSQITGATDGIGFEIARQILSLDNASSSTAATRLAPNRPRRASPRAQAHEAPHHFHRFHDGGIIPAMLTTRQWARLGLSIVRGLRDSTRTDELLVAEELVCRRRFANLKSALAPTLEHDDEARALLHDKPRMAKSNGRLATLPGATIDYDALRRLAPSTLGGTYARHLDRFGLDPDLLADPAGKWSGATYDDPDTAYLHERYRQTHDLWHALTGLGIQGHEEVLIHAFTWGQLRLPYSALIVVFGTLKHIVLERRWQVLEHGLRAAHRAGLSAHPLLLVYWERHWHVPVAEIRARYGIAQLAA